MLREILNVQYSIFFCFTYNFPVCIGYMKGFPLEKSVGMQGHTGQEPHSSKAKAIFVLPDDEQIV